RLLDGGVEARRPPALFVVDVAVGVGPPLGDRQTRFERGAEDGRRRLADTAADGGAGDAVLTGAGRHETGRGVDLADRVIERERPWGRDYPPVDQLRRDDDVRGPPRFGAGKVRRPGCEEVGDTETREERFGRRARLRLVDRDGDFVLSAGERAL